MEDVYRGYRITVEDRVLFHRVYVSPLQPWSPILHCSHFDWKGSFDEALAEGRHKVDQLLDWGVRK
jgi:hypothetical protein